MIADDRRRTGRSGDARHPMAVAEERTGLSSHVLRAWEKRYGAVEPARTDGGHRLYSDAEIHRLRLLRLLTERGRRIGRIAGMETEELEALAAEDRREVRRARRLLGLAPDDAAGPGGEEAAIPYLERGMEAVETMDAARLADLLRRAALELPVSRMVERVALPLLREIGDRWHAGELTVAREHVASAVIRRSLHWVLEEASVEEDAPMAVLGTLSGERHEGGALAAAATAHSEGWRVLYLGADLPPEALARACRDCGARVMGVSLVGMPAGDVGGAVRTLRALLPEETVLVVGGPGVPGLRDVEGGPGRIRRVGDLAGWRDALRELEVTGGRTG